VRSTLRSAALIDMRSDWFVEERRRCRDTSAGRIRLQVKPRGVNRAATISEPRLLLMLGAPRSFTTVVSSMLGQHPEMYALPETNLFTAADLAEWWQRSTQVQFRMTDGLRRAVAQLYFGEQTDGTIQRAAGWLWRRSTCSTGFILELLADQVRPRILIEKSPSTVHSEHWLRRTFEMFPRAKFLHLVRHPRAYGESVLKQLSKWRWRRREPPSWLFNLATFENNPVAGRVLQTTAVDPQKSWYALNMKICRFLTSIPDEQKLQVRGEDILVDPDSVLPRICNWLGVRVDASAIDAMKHPECSHYASYGPPSAPMGNDHLFLEDPFLRPVRAASQSLDGPLSWHAHGKGFTFETKELASRLGYE